MAEAVEPAADPVVLPPIDTTMIICRYFQHGICRLGDGCRYSHDFNARSDNVCRYYQLGQCLYGSSCRYDHIRPGKGHTNSSQKTQATGSCSSASGASFMSPGKSPNGPSPSPSKSVTSPLSRTGHTPLLSAQLGPVTSNMVKLTKATLSPTSESNSCQDTTSSLKLDTVEWVKAPEFVPGQKWGAAAAPMSYLDAAQAGLPISDDCCWQASSVDPCDDFSGAMSAEICPYAAHGECRFGESCPYLHGEICDMCGLAVLSLHDQQQREKHIEECIREHEQDMELSFAVQRSADKACGICMDVVWEKQPPTERRFGILSDCTHIFCLDCIRKWRSAKQFERKIVRACPECRVKSDFVTPSKYWVDDKADKQALIESYKKALSKKACKYFDEGRGECPFNDKCFYKHAYPDGRIASPKPVRRRRRVNAEGDPELVHELNLWDMISMVEESRARLQELGLRVADLGLDDEELNDLINHFNVLRGQISDDDDDDDEDEDSGDDYEY